MGVLATCATLGPQSPGTSSLSLSPLSFTFTSTHTPPLTSLYQLLSYFIITTPLTPISTYLSSHSSSLSAPLVGLESVPAVLESVGTQQVCAYRLSPSTTLSTLSLSLLVDGAPGQTITFSAGSSRACTSVTIVDDRTVEENEKMIVELVYSGSTSLSFLGSTTYISITDDDGTCLCILSMVNMCTRARMVHVIQSFQIPAFSSSYSLLLAITIVCNHVQ